VRNQKAEFDLTMNIGSKTQFKDLSLNLTQGFNRSGVGKLVENNNVYKKDMRVFRTMRKSAGKLKQSQSSMKVTSEDTEKNSIGGSTKFHNLLSLGSKAISHNQAHF
jgi:hypothetical protein